MKDLGTAKEVDCTFSFYMLRPSGGVVVFYETTLKDGARVLNMKMPETLTEQQSVLDAIKRAESVQHIVKKKVDRTPRATSNEGSMF